MSIFSRLFRKKSPEDAAQASAKGGKESPSVEESQAHQTTGGEDNTKQNMNNDVATKPKGCGQEEAKSTSADEKIVSTILLFLMKVALCPVSGNRPFPGVMKLSRQSGRCKKTILTSGISSPSTFSALATTVTLQRTSRWKK